MNSIKIVVTGPYNAGKTTFIKTISEIDVVSTERQVSESGFLEGKNSTTVAMDLGRITIDEDFALYLFGTPGQERFSFMWQTLSRGMFGYIILIDSSTKESLKESKQILDFFKGLSDVPYVVAVNKITDDLPKSLNEISRCLELSESIPLFSCDALDRESVKKVLIGLLYKVLETVERKEKETVHHFLHSA